MKTDKDDVSKTAKESSHSEFDENNIGELYYSPIDTEHIAEDESGVMYSDNEILVVAEEGVSFSEIEALAGEYNAEIVGYIEQTGDYQWKLSETKGSADLQKLIDDLSDNALVSSASVNYISDIDIDSILYDIQTGDEWIADPLLDLISNLDSKHGRAWGIQAINAPLAWMAMDILKENIQPIKVGLIDNEFDQEHNDLGFAEVFYENYEKNRVDVIDDAHGTHVAGTMAAKGNNDEGICGVYPYGDGRLYGASWKGSNQYKRNLNSSMTEKCVLSELIFRNVKVINCSYGYLNCNILITDGTTTEQTDYRDYIESEAGNLGKFLNRLYKDFGYDFIICVAAGNQSNKTHTFYENKPNEKK